MKDRRIWAFIAVTLLVWAVIFFVRRSGGLTGPAPAPVAVQPGAPIAPAPAPVSPPLTPFVSTAVGPAKPVPAEQALVVRSGEYGMPVPIQDGKTIDMSSGRPVVRDDARSRAALERGVKEMEEAAAGVTFGPRPAPTAEKKKAESTTTPPKS